MIGGDGLTGRIFLTTTVRITGMGSQCQKTLTSTCRSDGEAYALISVSVSPKPNYAPARHGCHRDAGFCCPIPNF